MVLSDEKRLVLVALTLILSLLCFLAVQRNDRIDVVENEMLGVEIVENALIGCAVLIGSFLGNNSEIFACACWAFSRIIIPLQPD